MPRQIIELLANYQGKKEDKFTEETPGKMMMKSCRLVKWRAPGRNSLHSLLRHDATPLWLVLVNRYVESSGDLEELARRSGPI